MDNLLLVHYLFEQMTTVIDVRRDFGVNIIFGAPRALFFKLEEIAMDDLMLFSKLIGEDQIEVQWVYASCTKKHIRKTTRPKDLLGISVGSF